MSNGNLSSALSQPLRTYNMHWFGLRAATMQCSWSNYRGVKRLAQGHNGDGLACTYNWYKYNGHLIEKHPPKGFSDEMHNKCCFFSTSILLQEWLNISCYSSSSSLASCFLLWVSFLLRLAWRKGWGRFWRNSVGMSPACLASWAVLMHINMLRCLWDTHYLRVSTNIHLS